MPVDGTMSRTAPSTPVERTGSMRAPAATSRPLPRPLPGAGGLDGSPPVRVRIRRWATTASFGLVLLRASGVHAQCPTNLLSLLPCSGNGYCNTTDGNHCHCDDGYASGGRAVRARTVHITPRSAPHTRMPHAAGTPARTAAFECARQEERGQTTRRGSTWRTRTTPSAQGKATRASVHVLQIHARSHPPFSFRRSSLRSMGYCDYTTGICACRGGFSGSACQLLQCPRGKNGAGDEVECSGQGRCMSMREAGAQTDYQVSRLSPFELAAATATVSRACGMLSHTQRPLLLVAVV